MRRSTQFSCKEHQGVKWRTDVRDPVITYHVNSTVIRDSIFAQIGRILKAIAERQGAYSSQAVTSTLIRTTVERMCEPLGACRFR